MPLDLEAFLGAGFSEETFNQYQNEIDVNEVREARAILLVEADHLVNVALDNNVDSTPFREYRQQLRDITQTYKTLKDVVWPQKPSLPQASA
ncbi:phage tail assembly chaperone [Vibrio cyclitrophicus]